jgi:hypothetical protein
MVSSKGNTCALPVARRVEPEVQLVLPGREGDRDEKTAIELTAIHPEQLDLRVVVGRRHMPGARPTTCRRGHDDDALVGREAGPLALDSKEPTANLEDEIGTAVFGDRSIGVNSEPNGGGEDLRLRDRSFQVGIEHERMFPLIPDGTAVPPTHRPNVQKVA